MRKILLGLVAAALVMSAVPASAKAPTSGSFSAQLLPFPKLATWGDAVGMTQPGCLAGEVDVHWHAEQFVAPKNGTISATTEGFTGDYDLYLLDEAGTALIKSEAEQIQAQAPALESVTMPVKAKQTVQIAVCNWLGAPDVTVNWEFIAAKKKG